jgi:hypothetical protein
MGMSFHLSEMGMEFSVEKGELALLLSKFQR